MNAKLQERCLRQIANESSLRQLSTLDSEESIKLGSLLYTALEVTADDDKLSECRHILQDQPGFFSNIRGALQSLLLLKMALQDDPKAYIDNVIKTHDHLTKDSGISGLFSILTAVIIYEQHGEKPIDEVIAQVLDLFEKAKAMNPDLSEDSDLAYLTLMMLSGKAEANVEEEKGKIFTTLKEKYQLSPDAAHSTAVVLITSSKPAEEKIEHFVQLYEALKAAGHATSTKRYISIYGAFTDLTAPIDEIAASVSDVDEFLKSQKGYGRLSINTDFRRVLAATLALQYYTIDLMPQQEPGDFEVSSGISIESLLFIVLMSIVAIV